MIFAAHFILFLFQFVSVENISYIKHSYLNSLGGGFSEVTWRIDKTEKIAFDNCQPDWILVSYVMFVCVQDRRFSDPFQLRHSLCSHGQMV